jgi:hypothetical protein
MTLLKKPTTTKPTTSDRVRAVADSLLTPGERARALDREREAARIVHRQDLRTMLANGNHEGVVAILRDERDLRERASLWACLEHDGQLAVARACPEVLPIARAAVGPLAVQLLEVDLDDAALPDVVWLSGPTRRTTARCEVSKVEAEILAGAGLTIATTLREDGPLPATSVKQDWLADRHVQIPERRAERIPHRYWCQYAFGHGAMEQRPCSEEGHRWARSASSPRAPASQRRS